LTAVKALAPSGADDPRRCAALRARETKEFGMDHRFAAASALLVPALLAFAGCSNAGGNPASNPAPVGPAAAGAPPGCEYPLEAEYTEACNPYIDRDRRRR
jgi:hypothetical protein